MQRLGKLIRQRNRQTGGMTIFTAILVLIVLTLMIFYAARVGRFEQSISANEVRQKSAFHAAEEAVEQGLEYVKANSSLMLSNAVGGHPDGSGGTRDGWAVGKWTLCTTANIASLSHPCGGQLPMRANSYYYNDATTGFDITGIISASALEGVTSRLTANMCKVDLGDPGNCVPFGTATPGGTFMIVTLMGYGYSDCEDPDDTTTCQGAAAVSKPVGNWKALGGSPTVPLVTRSVFPPNGTAYVVPNPNGGGVGVPISAWINNNSGFVDPVTGSTCDQDAVAILSSGTWNTCELQEWYDREAIPDGVACDQPTCSCTDAESLSYRKAGITTIGIDIVQDNKFPCDLFHTFFGVRDTNYANFKPNATVLPDCSSLDANSSGIYWISGAECQLSGGPIGSPDDPIVIISAAGETTINGNFTMFGVLYIFDGEIATAEFKGTGTASVYGTLIVDALMDKFSGTIDVVYAPEVLQKASDFGGYGAVNGGWRDFGLPELTW
jgi:Tfp pilus assembly protein PilX